MYQSKRVPRDSHDRLWRLRGAAVLTSEMRASGSSDEVRSQPTSAAAEGSWIGRSVQGRYQIEAQLGAGGMGTVYRARHVALDRPVALKLLRKQHHERWVSRKRFEREARALARLSHPHIVTVSDCGVEGDIPFLVMELLEGESLDVCLRRGRLPAALAWRLGLSLLDALGFAHESGLVHRDIKPGNVFLKHTPRGPHLVLLDFGLAKFVVAGSDATVTRSGEIFGTPAYMSPEQVTGEPTDARSDVYAAGLLLYEMVTGQRPYRGSESEMLRQQLVEPLPRIADVAPEVPAAARIDAVLERATAKEPAQRFADARQMQRAWSETQSPGGADARRATTLSGRRRATTTTLRGTAGGVLRAGAVLLCGAALAVIAVAAVVIVLLNGPDAAARRDSMQRTLDAFLERDAPARAPAPR